MQPPTLGPRRDHGRDHGCGRGRGHGHGRDDHGRDHGERRHQSGLLRLWPFWRTRFRFCLFDLSPSPLAPTCSRPVLAAP